MHNPVTATPKPTARDVARPPAVRSREPGESRFAPLFSRPVELAITTVDGRARTAAGRRVRARRRAALSEAHDAHARAARSPATPAMPDAKSDRHATESDRRAAVPHPAAADRGPRRVLAGARLPMPARSCPKELAWAAPLLDPDDPVAVRVRPRADARGCSPGTSICPPTSRCRSAASDSPTAPSHNRRARSQPRERPAAGPPSPTRTCHGKESLHELTTDPDRRGTTTPSARSSPTNSSPTATTS